jgi:hypothetical protein
MEKCCTGQTCKANGSYAIVPSADHVENGCTACVAGDTCPQEINGIPTACKASTSHVVPVPNNQIVLKSRTVDQPPSNSYRLGQTTETSSFPTLLICSSTTFLLHPASIQKMLENINLAEELSRPVIPSDVHSGSLDPDPLPQDSKEHHFQTIKTSKKHSS